MSQSYIRLFVWNSPCEIKAELMEMRLDTKFMNVAGRALCSVSIVLHRLKCQLLRHRRE